MEGPRINLHQLHSLYLYEKLDIIFESLDMINIDDIRNIKDIIKNNNLDNLIVVKDIFKINFKDRHILLIGNKINSNQYIINKDGRGDIFSIKYTCSDDIILKGIEYLYNIYKNISQNNNS
jgi:hypothetical protein